MIIIVYDPEFISHSTDVVRRNLLPKLAKRIDRIVWMVPEPRQAGYLSWLVECPNIELRGFERKYSDPLRWLNAIFRRIENFGPKKLRASLGRLRMHWCSSYVGCVCRELDSEWLFCISFMNQQIPPWHGDVAGMVFDVSQGLSESSLSNIDRWVKVSAVTFCISEFTAKQIQERQGGAPISTLRTVPLCPTPLSVSVTVSEQELEQLRPRTIENAVIMFFPAAFLERKGHVVLLEAVNIALQNGADFELVLSGGCTELLEASTEPENPLLISAYRSFHKFRQSGGRIQALGHVDDTVFERLMCLADVILFPSLFEGYGLPVSEAVQSGLPVIASDLPPIREQLDLFQCHERVRLVAPGDVDAWANSILEFTSGNGHRRIQPDVLSENFERWTWSHVANSIYQGLLDAKCHRS
jgi:glycosyltransferase involved in cell wall biosynthesis